MWFSYRAALDSQQSGVQLSFTITLNSYIIIYIYILHIQLNFHIYRKLMLIFRKQKHHAHVYINRYTKTTNYIPYNSIIKRMSLFFNRTETRGNEEWKGKHRNRYVERERGRVK